MRQQGTEVWAEGAGCIGCSSVGGMTHGSSEGGRAIRQQGNGQHSGSDNCPCMCLSPLPPLLSRLADTASLMCV